MNPNHQIATLAGGCFWCLEAVFDELNGVDWKKGCYMGQETVSRIVHMGQVRKILMGLRLSEGRASVDSVVLRDGREVGKVISKIGKAIGG